MNEPMIFDPSSLSSSIVEAIAMEVAGILTERLNPKEVLQLFQVVFLDVEETAILLRVKPKTISTWISQDRIPVRYAGGRPIFLLSELLRWTLPEDDKHSAYRLSLAASSKIAANRLAANRERKNPDGS
ncbi:MAG: helix-turn-helix domain-containing protein [Acidobacteria bacterium]|nr:helix-turn-helix domain-containing protein [Acidobacteriota bacterium]